MGEPSSDLRPIPLSREDAFKLMELSVQIFQAESAQKAGTDSIEYYFKELYELYTRARHGDYETPMDWGRLNDPAPPGPF